MKRYRILYNPLAGDGTGREAAMHLLDLLPDCELRFYDLTTIGSISSFLAKNDPKDALLLAGGDGTLSRFANEAVTLSPRQEVYYYATGVHNDFWHDIGRQRGDPPVRVNRYLENLPVMRTGDGDLRFLNGVTASAGVPFSAAHSHSTTVTVTVDGVSHVFHRAWLVTVTHGKHLGGFLLSPSQDRLSAGRTLTVTVLHGVGRFGVAHVLRALRTGRPVRHSAAVTVLTGKQITVCGSTGQLPLTVTRDSTPSPSSGEIRCGR